MPESIRGRHSKALGAALLLLCAARIPASAAETGPGSDFYAFANRLWLSQTALPPGRESYDTTAMLRERNAGRVRAIVEAAARQRSAGQTRKVGDYYASWTDTAAIDRGGIAPLADGLAAIGAIRDVHGLSAYLGGTLRLDDGTDTAVPGIFGLWVHQGFRDAETYRAHLVQGGLGLGERDAYLAPGADAADARARYRRYVETLLRLAGFPEPERRAERVLALETAIARVHAPRAETDDPFKTDNRWRRADFEAKAPGMDWSAWFGAAGLAGQPDFLVWQPTAVAGTSALAADQPLEDWKDYLAFHLIEHNAAVLPKAFREARAAFVRAQPDRASEAVAATNAALGDAVGRLYVRRYFPPAAKVAAEAMAANLRTAFARRIAHLTWMTPATRAKALAKLAALDLGLGHPDRWTDYSGLNVVRGDAVGNLRRAEAFAYRRSLARLGRPVDPGEWAIHPQDVGAILLLSPNSMQFSASLLQPPYFDPSGDLASNYGSAGAGMAHEISHSFDELGNLYDEKGRLGRWWSDEDLARYRAAGKALIAQYDAYCPAANLCLKGSQVFGESAADLAGLLAAHDAYLLALHGRPDTVRGGLTGEQRFFLAFARRWRRLQTDAALRRQVAGDSHAPPAYRAATVRNVDAWYRTFGVRPADTLYLPSGARIRIW